MSAGTEAERPPGKGESMIPATDEEIVVRYTNWRGETADRRIRPYAVSFIGTNWHPEPQWILEAEDLDKRELRQFAMNDMAGPTMAARIDKAESEAAALRQEVERLRSELGTTAERLHALSLRTPISEPVAWRVRVQNDDPEEWTLLPAGGGADYLNRPGYEVQPLYVRAALARMGGGNG